MSEFVGRAYTAGVDPRTYEMKRAMLEFTDNSQENSRLSCLIEVSDELDELRVTTPESQM